MEKQLQPEQREQLFEEIQFYMPADLGLDPTDRRDMILYVDSDGDRVLAGHLMAQRDVRDQHNAGTMDDENYKRFMDDLELRVAERRRKLGLPMPRP